MPRLSAWICSIPCLQLHVGSCARRHGRIGALRAALQQPARRRTGRAFWWLGECDRGDLRSLEGLGLGLACEGGLISGCHLHQEGAGEVFTPPASAREACGCVAPVDQPRRCPSTSMTSPPAATTTTIMVNWMQSINSMGYMLNIVLSYSHLRPAYLAPAAAALEEHARSVREAEVVEFREKSGRISGRKERDGG